MNRDEFGELYLEQRKRLVRLIYRWGTTFDEANELVQDAFEMLWKKILNGEHLDSPLAFLLTVCRNKTLNLLTSSYRKAQLEAFNKDKFSIGKDLSVIDDEGALGSNEGEFGDAELRGDCVRRRLHEFEVAHPDAAYVIRMQLKGLPMIKIAEAISRTSEATRQYIYQCKKKIRPYLEECRD